MSVIQSKAILRRSILLDSSALGIQFVHSYSQAIITLSGWFFFSKPFGKRLMYRKTIALFPTSFFEMAVDQTKPSKALSSGCFCPPRSQTTHFEDISTTGISDIHFHFPFRNSTISYSLQHVSHDEHGVRFGFSFQGIEASLSHSRRATSKVGKSVLGNSQCSES